MAPFSDTLPSALDLDLVDPAGLIRSSHTDTSEGTTTPESTLATTGRPPPFLRGAGFAPWESDANTPEPDLEDSVVLDAAAAAISDCSMGGFAR